LEEFLVEEWTWEGVDALVGTWDVLAGTAGLGI